MQSKNEIALMWWECKDRRRENGKCVAENEERKKLPRYWLKTQIVMFFRGLPEQHWEKSVTAKVNRG